MPPEKAFSTEEINAAVRKHLGPKPVKVGGLDGHHGVLAAFRGEGRVTVSGKAGDRLAAFLDGPTVTLLGSAGDYAGTTLVSGQLVVEGAVGRGFCCHMLGGRARLKGRSGALAGAMMTGGLLVLDGPVGPRPGEGMIGGTLVLTSGGVLPSRPVPEGARLLVPRGSAPAGGRFSEVELAHREVDELSTSLAVLGVEGASGVAEGLVRLVAAKARPPAQGPRAPSDGARGAPVVEVGPDATSEARPQGGGDPNDASERFRHFSNELGGREA